VPLTVNGSSGGGGESNGATDAPRLNGLLRMPSLNALDYTPSLAFAPRFEASRFLADLLLLSCNREDYRARKIQSLDRLDRNPAGFKDRRKPHLEGKIRASIDGGLALLVAASLKRLQDEREAGWAVNADAVEGGGGGFGGGGGQEKQAARRRRRCRRASRSTNCTRNCTSSLLSRCLGRWRSRASWPPPESSAAPTRGVGGHTTPTPCAARLSGLERR
ncbi:unnamed protein product, partial [Ectocarpus sp. 12 AP-2014]